MKRLRRFRRYGTLLAILLIAWLASYLCMRCQAKPYLAFAIEGADPPAIELLNFRTPDWLAPSMKIYRPLQKIDLALTDTELEFNRGFNFTLDYKF